MKLLVFFLAACAFAQIPKYGGSSGGGGGASGMSGAALATDAELVCASGAATVEECNANTSPAITKAIGATSTDGLVLENTTAATSGAQKWSPRLHWAGRGFETGTSSSRSVDWIAELVPVEGAANPQASLNLSYSVNGAPYTTTVRLLDDGLHLKDTSTYLNNSYSNSLININTASGKRTGVVIGVEKNTSDWFRALVPYAKSTHTSGTSSSVSAIDAVAFNTSTGNVSELVGANFEVYNDGAGLVTSLKGLYLNVYNNSGAVTNAYGLHVDTTGGTITNAYGVYIASRTAGTNRYSLYAVTDPVFHTLAKWGTIAEPTCNSTNRGTVVMVQGGAGVADTFRICSKDAADAYAYRPLI